MDTYLDDRLNSFNNFNPMYEHEWNDFIFEREKRRVYKNANVTIFLTDYCNAC